ncbi:metal ABC transporter ATP-binding protein [Pacificispira spongiicola]|nr:metal ABC transporter ATP-binding protein [Pacificispira spongiicola]
MTLASAPAPSDSPPLIRAEGIGARGGGRWLIRNVDLTVGRGEIVTLIGPNGSGKSTTVKSVLGVLTPDEGSVIRAPGLRVGYVPQKLAIDWTLPLTVDRLMSLTGPVSAKDRAAALDRTGIPHLAKAEVAQLSGGEFQRALLARAIARKPDLLVLDEPVQGVDVAGEVALYALIDQIRHETGCGILLISHDLHVVMAATDRVLCLNTHICCQGSPQSVAEDPAYRALFGDRAAASIAVYTHHHDHTHLPDGRVRLADGSVADSCEHDHHHDSHDHSPHAHASDKEHHHAG